MSLINDVTDNTRQAPQTVADAINNANRLPTLEDELQSQQGVKIVFGAAALGFFIITAVAAYKAQSLFLVFLLFAEMLIAFQYWVKIRAGFLLRIEQICFTQQIENVYVESAFPDDESVSATFTTTLNKLKHYGNVHSVRVYRFIFQDPQYIIMFYDAAGALQKDVRWREEGTTNETWEQFLQWCKKTRLEENDKRRRALRRDSTGADWYEQHLLNQAK